MCDPWMVAHVSRMKGLHRLPCCELSPDCPCVCGSGGLGELEGLEQNLLFVLVRFVWVPPPPLFFLLPGEFKFEVNKNIFLKRNLWKLVYVRGLFGCDFRGRFSFYLALGKTVKLL